MDSSVEFNQLKVSFKGSIQLEIENNIGMLGQYYTVDAYSGNILAADATNQQLLVFASDGQLLNKYGQRGFGPGEFEQIYSFTFDEDSGVAAFDMVKNSILWFNENGELKTEFKVDSGFNIMPDELFIKDGKVFIPAFEIQHINEPESSPLFLVYDQYGNLIAKQGTHPKYSFPIIASSLLLDDGNHGYYVSRSSYNIYKINLNDNQIHSYTNYQPKWFSPLEDNIAFGVTREEANKASEGKSFSSLVRSDSEIIHLYVNLTYDFFRTKSILDRDYFIVMYDDELNYLGETALDYPLLFSFKDKIYLLKNDDPDNFVIDYYTVQ
ncbi:MAG: 6-bladed beta-propeller [Balneolales bacterium]|nr:6-bladed beta-propeller [Balneolales bacterium]